jgi:DNA-directed RNA polymerase specialized sigma24 family protein
LLDCREPAARADAWSRFVATHRAVVTGAVAAVNLGSSAIEGQVAAVFEHVRRDEFRRLRAFASGPRCSLSTWLVTVARRLAVGHGLVPVPGAGGGPVRAGWSRLADAVERRLGLRHLADPAGGNPERQLRLLQLRKDLHGVLRDLSPPDRLLLALVLVDGMGAAEAARLLGLPGGLGAGRRVRRVLAVVRKALAGEDVPKPRPPPEPEGAEHLTAEEVAAYVDGSRELPVDPRAVTHLARCELCRADLCAVWRAVEQARR